MWLAKSDGTPIGVAIFGPDPTDRARGKIEALYVDTEWQDGDKHVGTQLLNRILGQMEHDEIVLDCARRNERGCRFWSNRGFEPRGAGDSYAIDGYGDVETVRYVLTSPARTTTPGSPSEAD
jgi:ribosomal protein S18 acetylase RimI-like enzyme